MKSKGKNTDIVIPVMGATGAGKSFFINTALRKNQMRVGRDLASCTAELGLAYVKSDRYPERQIVLVDTPGFDDTHELDFAILEKIAIWLKKSYQDGATMGGVIYLHDITAPRFTGTAKRNLHMFRNMCGEDVLAHVVLGTTKWALNVPDSDRRHRQLESDFWKPLTDNGALVRRFRDTYESAWDFIHTILSRKVQQELAGTIFLIQKELVDKKLTLPETRAAEELRYTLQEVIAIQKKMQSLGAGGDEDAQVQQEAREKVNLLMTQLKKLKIPFSPREKQLRDEDSEQKVPGVGDGNQRCCGASVLWAGSTLKGKVRDAKLHLPRVYCVGNPPGFPFVTKDMWRRIGGVGTDSVLESSLYAEGRRNNGMGYGREFSSTVAKNEFLLTSHDLNSSIAIYPSAIRVQRRIQKVAKNVRIVEYHSVTADLLRPTRP
ncbi:hypothetical protein GALMADRAFT_208830 [Galerina marginata CBS 339.88]|uniref:G domain-containing protein n=1 Tax=Galerina marginata (strain CBS 339.88) TaxID=685588 RepID=A0A067TAX5_GALM3|nr:hypothetical protein GALMADRAFT_208830 [Galerina marginata CBS 339.88]